MGVLVLEANIETDDKFDCKISHYFGMNKMVFWEELQRVQTVNLKFNPTHHLQKLLGRSKTYTGIEVEAH